MYVPLSAVLILVITSFSLLVDECLSFTPSPLTSGRNDIPSRRVLVAKATIDASTSEKSEEKDDAAAAAITDTTTSTTTTTSRIGTLRVHGPDANGIVAAFSQILYGHGCGIVQSEQVTDKGADLFFQRIQFDYGQMYTDRISIAHGIKEACLRFKMQHVLDWGDKRKRIAILVSKYEHCLWELLLRHDSGELDCDIALIISNHPDLQHIAESFKIPFHIFKVTKDTKHEVEEQELQLLQKNQVDVVILARYMQIVSDKFCESIPVINIHHSFLPAFIGGKPYHRAHARGVKVSTRSKRTCVLQSFRASFVTHSLILSLSLLFHDEW
jgi:formyltetrahydrofolate deformylase